MRRRPARLLLLLFQALWLNVIVPGHQRGSVVLPGTRGGVCLSPCCESRQGHSGSGSSSDSAPARPAACAICNFAAHLSTPPAVEAAPPPLRLLHLLTADAPRPLVARLVLLPYDNRGPPPLA